MSKATPQLVAHSFPPDPCEYGERIQSHRFLAAFPNFPVHLTVLEYSAGSLSVAEFNVCFALGSAIRLQSDSKHTR